MSDRELVELIEALAIERFSQLSVAGVRVRRDVDHDGDPIIWVNLLMADDAMPLDIEKTLPFGPSLRQSLAIAGERAAPVLSYYPASEFWRVYPEAA